MVTIAKEEKKCFTNNKIPVDLNYRWKKLNWQVHFFYKQSIFDPRPENCLIFSKKSPPKIV